MPAAESAHFPPTADTPEHKRLEEAHTGAFPGSIGGPISASASGARCARTTARAATPGTTSPTTRPARAPTAGARTASPASATTASGCACRWRCGTAATRSSRSACSASTNSEGNHGEDVKEYYFYLDSTPTHSYMKCLYKYPAGARFPTPTWCETNRRRGRQEHGVRAARHRRLRRGPLLRRVRRVRQGATGRHPDADHASHNRGPGDRDPAPAADAVVPQHWSWGSHDLPRSRRSSAETRRRRRVARGGARRARRVAACTAKATCQLLFTENETNNERLFGTPNANALRQGRHQRLRGARASARRSIRDAAGTKAAAHYRADDRRRRERSRSGCGCALGGPASGTKRPAVRRGVRRRLRRAPAARPTSSTSRAPRRRSRRTRRR